jgi:hypothetical protein
MKISVNCPSYKRPLDVKTFNELNFINVYVSYEEYEDYKRNYPDKNIIQCEKGIQGNLCRVRNYIMQEEFKKGAEVVCIIDDDFSGVYYFEKKEKIKVTEDNFMAFLFKYSFMAKELGVKFWGININQDKQNYREYSPFSMISYIGGPFQCFLKGNECYYDENLPLKEDYDMTLQQLNKYRKVLRINKFFYIVKQAEQEGGCATYRNFNNEMEQLKLLQKKWGSDIVRIDKADRSHNLKKKKSKVDFNPIIKAPIKGI